MRSGIYISPYLWEEPSSKYSILPTPDTYFHPMYIINQLPIYICIHTCTTKIISPTTHDPPVTQARQGEDESPPRKPNHLNDDCFAQLFVIGYRPIMAPISRERVLLVGWWSCLVTGKPLQIEGRSGDQVSALVEQLIKY